MLFFLGKKCRQSAEKLWSQNFSNIWHNVCAKNINVIKQGKNKETVPNRVKKRSRTIMNSSKICENYLIKKFFARPFCLTDHNLTETAKTFLTNLLRKTSCRNERYFSYICRSTEICFSYSIQLKTKMLQRAVKTTKKLPIHFLRNIYLLVPSIFNRHRKKAKVIKKPEKKSMSELF